jgi:hypothetical protein
MPKTRTAAAANLTVKDFLRRLHPQLEALSARTTAALGQLEHDPYFDADISLRHLAGLLEIAVIFAGTVADVVD